MCNCASTGRQIQILHYILCTFEMDTDTHICTDTFFLTKLALTFPIKQLIVKTSQQQLQQSGCGTQTENSPLISSKAALCPGIANVIQFDLFSSALEKHKSCRKQIALIHKMTQFCSCLKYLQERKLFLHT